MEIQRQISRARHEAMVGKEIDVLVEGVSSESEYLLEGRWYGQAPGIDGVTYLAERRGEARRPRARARHAGRRLRSRRVARALERVPQCRATLLQQQVIALRESLKLVAHAIAVDGFVRPVDVPQQREAVVEIDRTEPPDLEQ